MKTILSVSLVLVFTIGLTNQKSKSQGNSGQSDSTSSSQGKKENVTSTKVEGIDFIDWSGKVQIKVFYTETDKENAPEGLAKVGDGFVLVGGGALTKDFSGHGGFITASYPDKNLKVWRAKSKAHLKNDPHKLVVYAIGLKIDGVSADVLRSKMKVFTRKSEKSHQPIASVSVPSNYLLMGGGAKVEYTSWGNLLVNSYPSSENMWSAKSKEHLKTDLATLTVYAIGIENVHIPGFGYLETDQSFSQSSVERGKSVTSLNVPKDWALTCIGGKTTYSTSWGRMLMGMYLNNNVPTVISKDLEKANGGDTFVYTVQIRKKQ